MLTETGICCVGGIARRAGYHSQWCHGWLSLRLRLGHWRLRVAWGTVAAILLRAMMRIFVMGIVMTATVVAEHAVEKAHVRSPVERTPACLQRVAVVGCEVREWHSTG